MKRWIWTIVAIPIFTAACGKEGPGLVSPDPLPVCRTYATAFNTTTFTSGLGSSTGSTTCAFDRATLRLKCDATTVGPFTSSTMQTSTYASLADFVDEAAAVGRTRVQRIEFAGSSSAVHTYSYDGQKRPTRLEIQMNGSPFVTTTYTAWDTLGRPVAETGTSSSCGASSTVTTYDDAARTVTSTGNGCSSGSTLTTRYDATGNVLEVVFASGGTTTYSTTSSITATAAVCL